MIFWFPKQIKAILRLFKKEKKLRRKDKNVTKWFFHITYEENDSHPLPKLQKTIFKKLDCLH